MEDISLHDNASHQTKSDYYTPTLHGGREKILIGFILIILELEVFLHNSIVGLFVPYATASIGTNLMYN